MDRKSGGSSQDRRRLRRAEARAERNGTTLEVELAGIRALAASASGSKTLPLSDRDVSWDGSEAAGAVAKWASSDGSGDKDKIDWDKYGQAFAWKDSEGGDAIGDYKLGFADVLDGKLTAIFKGVTAAAGAVQGARGGVDIPSGDEAGVKSVLSSYYDKAAKQYGDDGIKPPWEAEASAGETDAFLLARAEVGASWFTVTNAGTGNENGGTNVATFTVTPTDEFVANLTGWHQALIPGGVTTQGGIAPVPADELEAGGKPSKGTQADRRLRRNKPEDMALAALDQLEQQHDVCGPDCTCGCEAGLTITLTAAAGDVAWGPEDGFMDLLCDLNQQLNQAEPGGGYDYGEDSWYGWPRVVDVSTDLSRALICDGDDYYVSVISGSADDDSAALAPREEWTPVEGGWIETSMAAKLAVFALVADGALNPPVPPAHEVQEELPPLRPGPDEPPQGEAGHDPTGEDDEDEVDGEEDEQMGPAYSWTATFVPEATLTDDGRAFAPDALTWRELPLTLMAMTETSEGGHIGAEVAGRIDNIWREGNLIKASGVFDRGDYGSEIARMVGEGVLRGLSVDIAIHEYETGPREQWFDDEGNWLATPAETTSVDDPFAPGIFVVTKGVIGMATVCPFPAFAEASISLAASAAFVTLKFQAGFTVTETASSEEPVAELALVSEEPAEPSLTASAAGHAPLKPPAEWFADPGFEEVTPLTIDEDGRIYGHAWTWETCHIAFPDSCVTAPHSQTENGYFHLGQIECEDGSMLPVGKVTLDTGHAGQRLGRADAIRHYDDTGTVAAHVCAGEDEYGGWVAGAIAPDLSDEKLRLLRGAVLSGDWRNVNGNLELVALLAVNVPGFPVPRPRALVASGDSVEVLALTAAAINVGPPTPEDRLAEIAFLAAEE